MRQLITSNLSPIYPLSMAWQSRLRQIVPGLLLVCLLAAGSPILCAVFCAAMPGPAVLGGASAGADTRVRFEPLHTPAPQSPMQSGPTHCVLHHSCCQLGLPLPMVALAPLLVLITLQLANGLAVLQASIAPTTPPPQLLSR